MNDDELAEHVMTALAAAIDHDEHACCGALAAIAATGDPHDMYRACCGFAEAARQSMTRLYGRSPDLEAGDMWAAIPLGANATENADPAHLFSMRFTIAYANDDTDTTPALFQAALNSGYYPESVMSLLLDAANLTVIAREAAA